MTRPNVAVIGCGAWGKNLVRVFYGLDALTMVCDTSPAGRELARQLAPGVRVVPGHAWVLTEPTIQGVVIATPAPTHYELAKQCLIAGLDVFVEKPLALSLRHALDLVETASRYGSVLMVGHVMLYHPAFCEMQGLIERGEIGEIQRIRSSRLNTGTVRPLPETVLWSFGPHDIAMTLALMGKMPEEIVTDGNVVHLDCQFGEVETRHWFSWAFMTKCRTFGVHGTKGALRYNGVHNTLFRHDTSGETFTLIELSFLPDEPLKLEALDFLHCLETRAEPRSSGVKALDVIEVLEQAHRGLV